LLEKLFVFGVPSFAACLSLLGLAVLVKKKVEGIDVPNHELLFRCSQFLAWVRSPLQYGFAALSFQSYEQRVKTIIVCP
jgi:hypothetical protein